MFMGDMAQFFHDQNDNLKYAFRIPALHLKPYLFFLSIVSFPVFELIRIF